MSKDELFWSCRHSTHGLRWVLASRKTIYAVVTGRFTPMGEVYFVAEYFVANKPPNKERGPTLAAIMALAELHYDDLGYVEPHRWREEARIRSIEGLTDKTGETDLAEYREE